MSRVSTKRKIGVFSHGGLQNLGDEALFAAVAQNVRTRVPEADVIGFTVNPQDTELRHGLPTFPIARWDGPPSKPTAEEATSEQFAGPFVSRWKQRVKAMPGAVWAVQSLRKLARFAKAVLLEPKFLWDSYRRLRGVELLLVAGSHQLNDTYGPWQFPLTLYKWSLLSRLTGTKFVILSVGAGPISSPFSQFMIRGVLSRCSYSSYRDVNSSKVIDSIGVKGPKHVFPDLAYSLRLPSPRPIPAHGKEVVIGINPVPYCDTRYWTVQDDARYREYVDKFARFTQWLDQNGYSTLFFPTQARADVLTIEDIRASLNGTGLSPRLLPESPIQTIDDLVSEIARADIVIANRYHGILLSLALNKPVLGVAYHQKSRVLLEQTGQGEYVVDTADFSVEDLIEKVKALHANAAESKKEIALRIAPLREALERQYDVVFALIGIEPPSRTAATAVTCP
jgi:polysaccharide pyruvyl transferase WcaK-like protein